MIKFIGTVIVQSNIGDKSSFQGHNKDQPSIPVLNVKIPPTSFVRSTLVVGMKVQIRRQRAENDPPYDTLNNTTVLLLN